MVALRNYGEKKALHHCGNYCTHISFFTVYSKVKIFPFKKIAEQILFNTKTVKSQIQGGIYSVKFSNPA